MEMFSYTKVNTSGLQLFKKKKKAICFHRSTEGLSAYAVSFTQKHGKKWNNPSTCWVYYKGNLNYDTKDIFGGRYFVSSNKLQLQFFQNFSHSEAEKHRFVFSALLCVCVPGDVKRETLPVQSFPDVTGKGGDMLVVYWASL